MTTSQTDRVLIFDTTLRDGEQSPGCSMTQPEKLRVAKALADLTGAGELVNPIPSGASSEKVNVTFVTAIPASETT